MSLYVARGGAGLEISDSELKSLLLEALEKLGERQRVLVVPPDITRLHSRAGELTQLCVGLLRRSDGGGIASAGHACGHVRGATDADVRKCSPGFVSHPQLADGH